MHTISKQIGKNLSACLCLYVGFSPGVVHFCRMFFHQININQYAERNHPKECKDDPCRMGQVLILFTGAALYALSSVLLISNKF